LKLERWGSLLVQEKYREEKACDKGHPYRIIIIIIIIPVIIIIIIIVAAQDQALRIKYYATKILNTETDSKCRLCQKFDETIDHIISAGKKLAKEKYIKRHDRVCAQLHFNICE